MSAWVGVAPLIGAGSLDGFAIGALASGAFFLAVTASRRGRKRHTAALSGRPGPHGEWLCEHVMAAEAFPAYAERLWQRDIPDLQQPGQGNVTDVADVTDQDGWVAAASQVARLSGAGHEDGVDSAGQEGLPSPAGQDERAGAAGRAGASLDQTLAAGASLDRMSSVRQSGRGRGWTFPARRRGRAASSYHSRHRRLSDQIPGSASPGRWSFGGRGAPREAASRDDLLPAGTSRHAAFPDSALHGASRDDVHRLPELAFPDDTFGTSGRPEVRRLPRHAAPGTSLRRKLGTRMSSRMASLTATRALIGGAHG
jgi:hypothetical protein